MMMSRAKKIRQGVMATATHTHGAETGPNRNCVQTRPMMMENQTGRTVAMIIHSLWFNGFGRMALRPMTRYSCGFRSTMLMALE